MARTKDHRVAAVETKRNAPIAALAFAVHLDSPKGGRVDIDFEFFDRGDQHMPTIGLASKDGGKQPHHCRTTNRRTVVMPGAVPRNSHVGMTAELGIPLFDRRQAAAGRSASATRPG